MINPLHWIATCFGIGKIPHLGTSIATLLAIIFAIIIRHYLDNTMFIAITVGMFVLGLVAAESYVNTAGSPSEVVIDEIVGMWVVLVIAYSFNYPADFATYLAAFISFRIFDGIKMWPISVIEESAGGGFGIMLDDVMAAAYGFLGMATMLFFYKTLLF